MLHIKLDALDKFYQQIMIERDAVPTGDLDTTITKSLDQITTQEHYAIPGRFSSQRIPLPLPFEALNATISVNQDTMAGNFCADFYVPPELKRSKNKRFAHFEKTFKEMLDAIATGKYERTQDSCLLLREDNISQYVVQGLENDGQLLVNFGEAGAPRLKFSNFKDFSENLKLAANTAEYVFNVVMQMQGADKKISSTRFVYYDYT